MTKTAEITIRVRNRLHTVFPGEGILFWMLEQNGSASYEVAIRGESTSVAIITGDSVEAVHDMTMKALGDHWDGLAERYQALAHKAGESVGDVLSPMKPK